MTVDFFSWLKNRYLFYSLECLLISPSCVSLFLNFIFLSNPTLLFDLSFDPPPGFFRRIKGFYKCIYSNIFYRKKRNKRGFGQQIFFTYLGFQDFKVEHE